jgi:hypothetical protein
VFELAGHEGSTEQHVAIAVIPTSENTPPACYGDRKTQRSDGTGPVDLYMHPFCWDRDGDEMVIRGGPPGVHPDSPKSVPSGSGDSNWHYRTATFSGDETTTIWATDVLGARSEDALLSVTVGPAVDQPPECRPSSWSSADAVFPIYSRPGMTRRFGLNCADPDGDRFSPRLSSPPERGQMPLFLPGDQSTSGYWGAEQWIDATYVPVDDSLERDPFSVTASGSDGDGPTAHMAIVPRALPDNAGAGCGWSPADITVDVPGAVHVICGDDDGDPLSVEILSEPRHGTIAPALITPARFGQSDITIPYVPNPAYEGYDCVKIKVTDGNGLGLELAIEIWVRPAPLPIDSFPALPLPPVPPLPPLPPGPLSSQQVRAAAERALGSRAVRRLRTAGAAEVWARSQLSRHDLLRYGRAPGLVVVCSTRCRIRADARLAAGARSVRSLRASRRSTLRAATSGQPEVVSLTIDGTERRALRRARKARAKFTLRIRAGAGRTSSLKPSIPISR